MAQSDVERLAVLQAIYNAIGADLKTGVSDNLRGQVNGAYLDLYEQTGAKSFEVRVGGQKVGTYSFDAVKGKPARTYSELEVTDLDALRADETTEWLEWCGRYIIDHIEELAVAYCAETGELLDGVELVERTVPATPDGIKPGGTLRVQAPKVADALGAALPSVVAGLLGGGHDA